MTQVKTFTSSTTADLEDKINKFIPTVLSVLSIQFTSTSVSNDRGSNVTERHHALMLYIPI